jgi:hypothetical protein
MVEEIKDHIAPEVVDNLGLIDRVEKATKILEETEKRLEAKKLEFETLVTRQMMSGRSSSGKTEQSEVSPEEKLKQDMRNYFKGSAIERALK